VSNAASSNAGQEAVPALPRAFRPKEPQGQETNITGISRKPGNHYNVSQFDSSLSSEFAKYLRSPAARCRRCIEVYLCVSSFLCSPLFASSLLPRAVQLALLRRSLGLCLRHRSPARSTSSSSRRYFVRSLQATARPRVNGSAVSSSATLIASNVIVLSADPFGSQSPPMGNLGRAFVFASTQPQTGGGAFGRPPLAPYPVVGDDRDKELSRCCSNLRVSCSASRSTDSCLERPLSHVSGHKTRMLAIV
jgi:hypothetical protein